MEPTKTGPGRSAESVFGGLHPAVELIYFCGVLGVVLGTNHPVLLLTALGFGIAWGLVLQPKGALRALGLALPLCLLAAVLNPLFNHEGATILAWLPGGNPLTRESICNGLGAGILLGAALAWFFCLNQILTTDKLICLFGRAVPALSLLISMTLRFVPRLGARIRQIRRAQRACGAEEAGGRLERVKQGLSVLSILLTWALESGITTADSMGARGYGLPGRTAYSLYRFGRRDGLVLALVLLVLGGLLAGALKGNLAWSYYPTITGRLTGGFTVLLFAAYGLLCALPFLLEGGAALRWRRLHCGI